MHFPECEIILVFYLLKRGKCWVIICQAALFCESKSQICQRMIPRFCNTPARGDFPGIYKDCVSGRVRMDSMCYLRYKTSHIGWCDGMQWTTLKLQEVWGQPWKKLWEVPELLFPGSNLCVQSWSCQEAANNLLLSLQSISKLSVSTEQKVNYKDPAISEFSKKENKKAQRKFYFSTEVEMSVGGGSFGEVFMFSFCFLFLFFPLFFHKEEKKQWGRTNKEENESSFEVRPWQKAAHKQGQPLNGFHIVLDLMAASIGCLGTNIRKRKILN